MRYYKTSSKGLAFIAGLEGVALSKYLDSVGVWTIGIGATVTEIPDIASWPLNKTITIEEAFELLKKSVTKYELAVNKALNIDISQNEFDALVSWCYNVGTGAVAKSTIIKRINAGLTDKALAEALLMWKKPPEITGRRIKEAKLLTDGVYAGGGKANVFPVNPKGKPIYSKGKEVNVFDYIKNT